MGLNRRISFFIIFLLFTTINLQAQYFNDGQEPANKKWLKISSLHFEIIFPEEFKEQGLKVAQMMEKAYGAVGHSLQHQPKKVSVILHNQTVKSNAFLGWAPSRIEFYATPHQTIYSQDWLEQLAIHEYRHMVQVGKIEAEMPALFRYLFGEQAAAMIVALHFPFWLIEGDAVCAETGLSQSGRGRLPDFYRETRALLTIGKKYSYEKSYLGSYKDFVPDYYRMGFLLAGGARHLCQKNVWDSVFHMVSAKPYKINALDKALKKTTGLDKISLYDTVYLHLQKKWMQETEQLPRSTFRIISPEPNVFTNYLYGKPLNDGHYFALKNALNDIDHFVILDKRGNEKRLKSTGYIFDESVSASDSMVIWSEYLNHPRWAHADRSLLNTMNLYNGQKQEFRFDTKIFAPTLSPDQKMIAVVEANDRYQFFLSVIDRSSGKIIWRFQSLANDYFITPSWSNDGKQIIAISLRNNQKAIISVDIRTKNMKLLLPFANQEISKPIESGNKIIFVGGYSGIDNLYELDPSTGVCAQITHSQFGVRHPATKQNQLIYSDYNSSGYQLVGIDLTSADRIPVDLKTAQVAYPLAETVAKQEGQTIDFSHPSPVKYQSTPYVKAMNQFNFHSWAPVFIDPYNYSASPGISLMSQNKLGTTEALLGYKYDIENRHGIYLAKVKYKGWYPEIEAEANYGRKSSTYLQLQAVKNNAGETIGTDTIEKSFDWRQTNLDLTASLPLNFSKGKYFKWVEPRINYQYSNINLLTNLPSTVYPNGAYQNIDAGLFLYLISRSSHQDLLPNFGIVADFDYSTSLKGVADFGSSYSAAGMLYLPGFRPNHGLKLYGGSQLKQPSTYSFSDRIRIARGHQRALNRQLTTIGSDYLFPIVCPDLKLGRWFYIKRIKASVFYDQSWLEGLKNENMQLSAFNYSLQSAGFELTSDLHVLRFIAPIEAGFRSAYLFGKGFHFDFLFNIQFSM